MAITYAPANTNVALNGQYDKAGDAFFRLKNALAATGLWRVKGSGDGGSLVQNRGQTAGLGGSAPWDVLTAAIAGTSGNFATGAAGSFSRVRAWYIMEELDAVGGNPTGRAFCVKRSHSTGNDTGLSYAVAFVTDNFQNSGATSTTPPSPVSTALYVNGSTFADGGAAALMPKTGLVTYGETNQAYDNLTTAFSANNWLHIGIENAPGADKVVGFQMQTFCRTDGQTGIAFYYRAYDNAVASNQHPAVVAIGSWSRVFGIVGAATHGPFAGTNVTFDLNSGTAARYTLRANQNTGGGVAHPSGTFQPGRSDGKHFVTPIEVVTAAGGQVGTLRNCYPNIVNRNYPTTYGVVAPNIPRFINGHMITEWVNGSAPGFTP